MKAGQDAAPAGVVRSCAPGRTPEQPRRLLSGRQGPGTVKRESGKMSRGAPTGVVFFPLPRLLGAPTPRFEGREKRRALPRPSEVRDQQSVGFLGFATCPVCPQSHDFLLSFPHAGLSRQTSMSPGSRLRGNERGRPSHSQDAAHGMRPIECDQMIRTRQSRAVNQSVPCRNQGDLAQPGVPKTMLRDSRGHVLSGATAQSAPHYEAAVRQFSLFMGDPVATIDQAIAASPDFVMAHALRAWLHLLGTEPAGIPVARAALAMTGGLPATAQEKGHLAAIAHLLDGRWHAASAMLEDISIDYPRDLLALQAGHQTDFFRGDARMLRDRIARALPFWSAEVPGYHAVLGMQAFGLEETGAYAAAERFGRRAVDLEPRDAWAQHAVAHVMEMQCRHRDGIAWMMGNADGWSEDNFFARHNWWHVALYHLDLGEVDEALALFDGPIYGERSRVVLDMIDASAMLWRLHLRGVALAERWQPVVAAWEPLADAGNYAFNDVHAAMAFVG